MSWKSRLRRARKKSSKVVHKVYGKKNVTLAARRLQLHAEEARKLREWERKRRASLAAQVRRAAIRKTRKRLLRVDKIAKKGAAVVPSVKVAKRLARTAKKAGLSVRVVKSAKSYIVIKKPHIPHLPKKVRRVIRRVEKIKPNRKLVRKLIKRRKINLRAKRRILHAVRLARRNIITHRQAKRLIKKAKRVIKRNPYSSRRIIHQAITARKIMAVKKLRDEGKMNPGIAQQLIKQRTETLAARPPEYHAAKKINEDYRKSLVGAFQPTDLLSQLEELIVYKR